jgi:hypothetical protein
MCHPATHIATPPPGEAGGSTIRQTHEYKPPTGKLCQVFISHAGEQKRGFVDFLRKEFNDRHAALEVFVDQYSLKMGGSAMPAIEAALGDAFVGTLPTMHVPCLCIPQVCLPLFCSACLVPGSLSPFRCFWHSGMLD